MVLTALLWARVDTLVVGVSIKAACQLLEKHDVSCLRTALSTRLEQYARFARENAKDRASTQETVLESSTSGKEKDVLVESCREVFLAWQRENGVIY